MPTAIRPDACGAASPAGGELARLEAACAEALAEALGAQARVSPLSFSVHWTGAVAGPGRVAEAEVVQVSAELALLEGVLLDEAGTTCARLAASYRVSRP